MTKRHPELTDELAESSFCGNFDVVVIDGRTYKVFREPFNHNGGCIIDPKELPPSKGGPAGDK